MEFDRNRRPQYGRYSRNDDRDRGDRRDRGGYQGGGDRGGRGGNQGGYRGGNDGGGYREKRESFDGSQQRDEAVFSEKVRAGKRRTYFFDVRQTRGEDYFITITESTRRSDGYGHTRHKIFLYKEDFNRFSTALNTVISKVKEELNPDFDYGEFDRRQAEWEATNLDEEGNYIGGEKEETEIVASIKAPTKPAEKVETASSEDDNSDDNSSEIKSEDDMSW